jgi:hypothetical protein
MKIAPPLGPHYPADHIVLKATETTTTKTTTKSSVDFMANSNERIKNKVPGFWRKAITSRGELNYLLDLLYDRY